MTNPNLIFFDQTEIVRGRTVAAAAAAGKQSQRLPFTSSSPPSLPPPPPMSLLSYTTAANTGIFSPSLPPPPSWTTHHTHRTLVVAQARKGISSSRTRRLEKQGKKEEEEEEKAAAEAEAWAARQAALYPEGTGGGSEVYSTGPMPNMEWEEKTDFWEGPQWEWFGFFLQYQWAFGVAFALVACGIAVTTYNEGATDFKQTPIYKESLQSQELLEEPDASNSNVFEGNPTEEAPSLE